MFPAGGKRAGVRQRFPVASIPRLWQNRAVHFCPTRFDPPGAAGRCAALRRGGRAPG